MFTGTLVPSFDVANSRTTSAPGRPPSTAKAGGSDSSVLTGAPSLAAPSYAYQLKARTKLWLPKRMASPAEPRAEVARSRSARALTRAERRPSSVKLRSSRRAADQHLDVEPCVGGNEVLDHRVRLGHHDRRALLEAGAVESSSRIATMRPRGEPFGASA